MEKVFVIILSILIQFHVFWWFWISKKNFYHKLISPLLALKHHWANDPYSMLNALKQAFDVTLRRECLVRGTAMSNWSDAGNKIWLWILSNNRTAKYRTKLNADLTLVRHRATLLQWLFLTIRVNTKHSDFNKLFVNLLSGEPIANNQN